MRNDIHIKIILFYFEKFYGKIICDALVIHFGIDTGYIFFIADDDIFYLPFRFFGAKGLASQFFFHFISESYCLLEFHHWFTDFVQTYKTFYRNSLYFRLLFSLTPYIPSGIFNTYSAMRYRIY